MILTTGFHIRKFAVLEVPREDEFSPVKNGPDAERDTPLTARLALMDLHYRQFLAAGGRIVNEQGKELAFVRNGKGYHLPKDVDAEGKEFACEISPLVSYFGEVSFSY